MVSYRYSTQTTAVVFPNPKHPNDNSSPTFNCDVYIRRAARGEIPASDTTVFKGLRIRDETALTRIGDLARALVDVLCKAESFALQIAENVSSTSEFPPGVPEIFLSTARDELQFYAELYKNENVYHREPLIATRPPVAFTILQVDTANLMSGKRTIPANPEAQKQVMELAARPNEAFREDLPARLSSIAGRLTICQELLTNNKRTEFVQAARDVLDEADLLKVDCYIASKVVLQALPKITESQTETNPLLVNFREYYDEFNDTDKVTLVELYNDERQYRWGIRDSF